MEIKELLEKQKALDELIVYNYNHILNFDCCLKQDDFLTERLLALQVEVSELANATRCFKYWSQKESEPRERLLDEYADCLHFLLSVGHTLGFSAEDIEQAYLKKHEENYKRQEEGY
jgi:dimeric dUTPase (all-alpha-NTP-PPase superfamily)